MNSEDRNELKFKKRRQSLVEELRSKGIKDERILQAFETVPRHRFVDSALSDRAYEDCALPIEHGQTISQPYTVARQTELIEVQPDDKVLEIGTGSGYQAALLCEMGARVYTVERHRELTDRARNTLRKLGYRVEMKTGDGSVGWSAYSPYDGILVTAAAPVVPDELKKQLSVGGRLVVPVGDKEKQAMCRIIRVDEEEFDQETFSHFKFVPLMGRYGWK